MNQIMSNLFSGPKDEPALEKLKRLNCKLLWKGITVINEIKINLEVFARSILDFHSLYGELFKAS